MSTIIESIAIRPSSIRTILYKLQAIIHPPSDKTHLLGLLFYFPISGDLSTLYLHIINTL